MLDYLSVLKTFVAVMECGSMIEASRARRYSAGAVTRQIGWLQRRIGVRLFEPDGRSIQPTVEAITLVEYARAAIREAERFDQVARKLAGAPRARQQLGSPA
jgi:DNA-binding transcriptional LysR family regulator